MRAWFLGLGCLLATSAGAVPAEIAWTGRLLNPAGAPFDGPASVTVSLWASSSASSSLWSHTFSLTPEGGYFSVTLGAAGQPALDTSILDRPEVWVDATVAGVGTLSPRQRLLSVPYARVAQSVVGGPVVLPTVTLAASCSPANSLGVGGDGNLALCSGGVWKQASSVDVTVKATSGVRRWSDGSLAATCDEYRHPTLAGRVYGGDIGSGSYEIAIAGLGNLVVTCDMDEDGGGWTTIARVRDQVYTTNPPNIGTGNEGTFAQWADHSWTSNGDWYLSLKAFGLLTNGVTDVLRMSKNSSGTVQVKMRYNDFDYNHTANTSSMASCTNLVDSKCTSSHNWISFPPNFDGWGETNGCHGDYTRYYNYHNFASCASDSGLFAYDSGSIQPQPGYIGYYNQSTYEQILLVR